MKILLYAHPAILSDGASFNRGWVEILNDVFLPLTTLKSNVEIILISGLRFREVINNNINLNNKIKYITIDEWQLHNTLALNNIQPQSLTHALYTQDIHSNAINIYTEFLIKSFNKLSFTPDLVISFSIDATFFKRIWSKVVTLTMEVGLFRGGFTPKTIFFDDTGIHSNSTVSNLDFNLIRSLVSEEQISIKKTVMKIVEDSINEVSPLKFHDYHYKYEKICLLPLQVSPSYTFYEQCQYKTQIDYALDFISQIPDNIGVIVTEYSSWGSIFNRKTPINSIDFFKYKKNFIYPNAIRFIDSPSFYAFTKTDGIWSISSNVGWLAVFFNKILGSPSNTQFSKIAYANTVKDFCSNLLNSNIHNYDILSTWLIFNYYIPSELYENPQWLNNYLQKKIDTQHLSLSERFPTILSNEEASKIYGVKKFVQPSYHPFPVSDISNSLASEIIFEKFKFSPIVPPYMHINPSLYTLVLNIYKKNEKNSLISNLVSDFINFQLTKLGYIQTTQNDETNLLVVNFEGILENDSHKIENFLNICEEFKTKTAITVLLNAFWSRKFQSYNKYLGLFDIISVRESSTLKIIKSMLVDQSSLTIIPDFSFEAFDISTITWWCEKITDRKLDLRKGVVINTSFNDVSNELLDYAQFFEVPFYYMEVSTDNSMKELEKKYIISNQVYPKILKHPETLASYDFAITDSLHGIILLLCLRIIPLYVPNNSLISKDFLKDIGIKEKVFLPKIWLNLNNNEKDEIVNSYLNSWKAQDWNKVNNYIISTKYKIFDIFNEIYILSSATPNIKPQMIKFFNQTKSITSFKNFEKNQGNKTDLYEKTLAFDDENIIYRYGWSNKEDLAIWSIDKYAGIRIFLEENDTLINLSLYLHPYINELIKSKKMYFFVNRELVLEYTFKSSEVKELILPIKNKAFNYKFIDIHIACSDISSPSLLYNNNGDTRLLNVMLHSIKLYFCRTIP